MKFVDSYMNYDGTQLVLSFVADDRIDFRDLVKDLAAIFKTRISRQGLCKTGL